MTLPLQQLSVIVTAIDETWSLEKTVDIVLAENSADVLELVIAIAPRTTVGCRKVITDLEEKYGDVIKVHEQKVLKFVGGALRECFELVSGEYVVIMAADLETDPHLVKTLLKQAKANSSDVVATTRWREGGNFVGYSMIKLYLNWVFQKCFAILYNCDLTDMTYGYRLYRTEVVRAIKWEETRHAFFFESIIKPLRLGYRIIEIPTSWHARQEGSTNLSLSVYFEYFVIGFRVRFNSKRALTVTGSSPNQQKSRQE